LGFSFQTKREPKIWTKVLLPSLTCFLFQALRTIICNLFFSKEHLLICSVPEKKFFLNSQKKRSAKKRLPVATASSP
jgi:hypothetical protein